MPPNGTPNAERFPERYWITEETHCHRDFSVFLTHRTIL